MSRIAIVAPVVLAGFGGAQQHILGLRGLFEKMGHCVTIFSETHPSGSRHPMLARWLPSAQGAVFGHQLQEYPAFSGFDIVLSFDLAGVGIAHPRHLRVLAGSYIGFRHYALPPAQGLGQVKRVVLNQVMRFLELKANGERPPLACSHGLKKALADLGVPTHPTVVPPSFRAAPDALRISKEAARERVGIYAPGPTLMFAGRWEYAKGADRMDSLLARLPAHWNIILAIPNPQALSPTVRRRATFVGSVHAPAMPLFYRAADVLMLPSRFEGSSLAIAEAMACRTPVLTTETGSGLDLQLQGGLLREMVISTPDDLLAWERALLRLEDLDYRQQAADAAYAYASAAFSDQALMQGWNTVLDTL